MPAYQFAVEVVKNDEEEYVINLIDNVNDEAWELIPYPTSEDAEEDAEAIREFANNACSVGRKMPDGKVVG